MRLIAQHPFTADMILPYCGRSVVAVTHYGDVITGTIDRVSDGLVYFKAADLPQAAIRAMRQKALSNPKVKKILSKKKSFKRNVILSSKSGKVKTKGFGFPFFGFPFFGFGLGAALAFTIPFILLAALFAY